MIANSPCGCMQTLPMSSITNGVPVGSNEAVGGITVGVLVGKIAVVDNAGVAVCPTIGLVSVDSQLENDIRMMRSIKSNIGACCIK